MHGSTLRRFTRRLHALVFRESREGRAAEIVAWANAAASFGLGASALGLGASLVASALVAAAAFVLLRLALVHRVTVWVAAALGTTAISGAAGGLAWLFAHAAAHPYAPPIAAAAAGVVAAILPTRAYHQIASRRARAIRDSLIEPLEVSSSRATR